MVKHMVNLVICLFVFISVTNAQESQNAGKGAIESTPDTTLLEEVSISVMPFREKYLEATASVFIRRPDEILRENALVSTGLYNSAPGVHMASGALNTNRVVIRGVGSRTPYNSNRIRAYLDDIPLTSGDGVSTLEDMDMLAIGSMEVLKGPSSALYGSGLGGVIRLNSPYPSQQGWNTSVIAEAASFHSQRYALTGSVKKGDMAISGGYSRSSTDGYRENSSYLRNSAFLHARVFWQKHSLSLTLSMVDLHAGIPSSLNEEDFLNNPEKAGGSWGILKGYEEYLKVLGGIKLESKLGSKLHNSLILHSAYGDPYERRPFNILDEQSSNLGIRDFIEYRDQKFSLGAGLEFFRENFRWRTFETQPEGQGPLLSDQQEKRSYLNTFAFGQWRPAPRILVDAGLNLNLLSYSLSTLYRIDSADQSGAYSYDPVLSPRLGFSFLHGKHIRTYASAGHGFSQPSLEETLLPEGMINTALRPESGWNLDLGNRGALMEGHLVYDLSLYSIFLKDLLVTERVAEDIFTGVNAGNAWNRGLELFLSGHLFTEKGKPKYNAGLQLSYHLSGSTFTDFVDEGVDYSGKQLPGIPQQVLRAELSGRVLGFHLVYQHVFTGQQWMDDANETLYGSYHLDHLQLSWSRDFASTLFHLKVYGGIRNLGATHHASMILINAPSFGGRAPRYYYPGTPRYFHLGTKLSIKPAGARKNS